MFEFDPAKSAINKAKHGIDFNEAQALWRDDRRIVLQSQSGINEIRWLVIGRIDDLGWTVIVTIRDGTTRIISARRARRQELELYGH